MSALSFYNRLKADIYDDVVVRVVEGISYCAYLSHIEFDGQNSAEGKLRAPISPEPE
jgi:hypothetical protein